MKTTALLALALLALSAGCKSSCRQLGERICACQPVGSPRDNCNQEVANVLGGQNIDSAAEKKCEALLSTCADPTKDAQMCARIQTEEGKIACGLAFPRQP